MAQSLAVFAGPPPRSILKPTIPLVPEIPSFKPKQTRGGNSVGSETGGTKVALRTEEEQQAAAREREERERAEMEKEIKDRREARRKSLANRRVSFAAEATLHTFHEIEEQQDATTSTDSNRRTSSHAAQSSTPQAQQHPNSDPPSTPPDYVQDHVDDSPANQRDLHQRKRRRSSGAASMYSEEDTIASSVYDSDLEHADSVAEIQGEEMTGSSDSDEDGTVMTVDAEEMTSASVASARSAFSPDSTGSLDENLRLAARMAATQRADDEEEEVIAGFAGWGRKNHSQENIGQGTVKENQARGNSGNAEEQGSDTEMEMDADMDMDMTNAVGGILYPQLPSPDKDDEVDEDMSMDVTTALGGILSKAKAFLRRKSAILSAQSEPEEFGDQTMEFTTAVGGIHNDRVFDDDQTDIDGNEDMSMEFTAVMGNLMSGAFSTSGTQIGQQITEVDGDGDEDDMMDMTTAVGRILPTEVGEEEDADQTIGMDMTVAVGGIIQPAPTPEARSAARRIMEQEADEPDPFITTAPERTPSPKRPAPAVADGKASPGFSAFQGNGLRRSLHHAVSPVVRSPAHPSSSPVRRTPVQPSSSPVRRTPAQPSSSPARRTPVQSSSSPVRRTASPKRNTTQVEQSPKRTTPSRIRSASSSPVRNISPPKTTPRSASKARLFHQDPSTGLSTPRIVLTPQGRRLSGVGADRPGLGSPRVAEIFDRRESIGEAATDFVPSQPANPRRAVAFADPRVMESEIDKERQDEQEKEDSRRILEREVNGSQDDREVALNLREMIQGLSPKKSIFRGRKSLHVGSARGLLGKRPVELDDDEELEDMDGVKRLKGHQGSPVKNIRLQSPPSKAETTTGRKTRPSIRPTESATATPSIASSPQRATTPRSPGRFRNVYDDRSNNTMDFEHTVLPDEAEVQQEDDGERMHLQDFLNMTSIRFMELTTTKRRHTIAPSAARDSTAADGEDDVSLEGCVVAGACTVPMLELYQHVSDPSSKLVRCD
jgi:kinetochore protein Spc7/SPC105